MDWGTAMIISASRRTDIPACYANWFYNRLQEGYVLVRNPMNHHQISRICLSADVVDGIVFWTKNPAPMMERLHLLQDYAYYVQFTLNAYGKDLEPRIPSKQDVLIPVFQALSRQIGPERVIWRYDPVILTDTYTAAYHVRYFAALAKRLAGFTDTCVISFVDDYRHLHWVHPSIRPLTEGEILCLAENFSTIAQRCGLNLATCAEAVDLSSFGIGHSRCIDGKRLERILGQPLQVGKDRNQRPHCGCDASVDIGMYNSCSNGCVYCYANHTPALVKGHCGQHDPSSPLLYGTVGSEDVIKDRKIESQILRQINLFLKM